MACIVAEEPGLSGQQSGDGADSTAHHVWLSTMTAAAVAAIPTMITTAFTA